MLAIPTSTRIKNFLQITERTWRHWAQDDLTAEWRAEVPTAGRLEMQSHLNLKRGPRTERVCLACGEPAKAKCSLCFAAHYCNRVCQRAHWTEHKQECTPPTPQVESYVAIAVPESHCTWVYQAWQIANDSSHVVGRPGLSTGAGGWHAAFATGFQVPSSGVQMTPCAAPPLATARALVRIPQVRQGVALARKQVYTPHPHDGIPPTTGPITVGNSININS